MALRQDYVAGPRHHLFLAGCDLVALAREHGTPLYVYDERYIRAQCRAFREAIEAFAPAGGEAHYASKAFSTVAMCRRKGWGWTWYRRAKCIRRAAPVSP